MAPYPASAGAYPGTAVVPRSASPSSVPFLPNTSFGVEGQGTVELSARLPSLNVTARTITPVTPTHNITTRSDYTLSALTDHNLTPRSDLDLTSGSDSILTSRSDHKLTARFDYDFTKRSYLNTTTDGTRGNLTTKPYPNVATRGHYSYTAQAENNITEHVKSDINARPEHNLTTRTADRPLFNITTRSAHDLSARSSGYLNLTTRSDLNLTTQFEFNLTSGSEDYNTSETKMYIRTANPDPSLAQDALSPKDIQSAHRLFSRATINRPSCQGCTDPGKINNNAFFALFALIGVVMVVVAIWFFFHAKNGGFVWQEHDWDDYKSTVLRRKGPDGKTLSNATKSTRLGGGSIIAKHDRLAAMTVVGYDEKGRKGIRAKRGFGGTHSVYYDDDFSRDSGSRGDEMSEVRTINDYHIPRQQRGGAASNESRGPGKDRSDGHHSRRYRDRDVRDYKHEKPARVGGMNRVADGSAYTYSEDSATVITESTNRSSANLIKDSQRESDSPRSEEKRRAKAERKAHEEASRMERKWRKDAEAAARAIARENAPSPIPPQQAHRARQSSTSRSPKKRDYSFSKGADEVLSTAYTASSSGDRSYYDAYRPKNESVRSSSKPRGNPSKAGYRRYAESEAETSDSGTRTYEHRRSSSRPVKEKKTGRGGRDVMAGYRRGRDEDDF